MTKNTRKWNHELKRHWRLLLMKLKTSACDECGRPVRHDRAHGFYGPNRPICSDCYYAEYD